MISIVGDVLQVSGAMKLGDASKLLEEGNAALKNAETVFDLEKVDTVDSSAIAVIFGWLRKAREEGKSVRIAHPPKELLSLAEVYGVSELLPL